MKKINKSVVSENNKNLQKRKTNNPGGRPKGTHNRTSNELKAFIIDFINENLPTIQQDFQILSAEKKLFFLEKIMQYIVPKTQPTPEEIPENTRPTIIVVSNENDKLEVEKFINSDD